MQELQRNLVLAWNDVLLSAIRAVGKLPSNRKDKNRGGPPQVARSIGIVYTAIYDAWSAFDARANPRHRTTNREPDAQHTTPNRRQAISKAAYQALIDQFPPGIYDAPFKAEYETQIRLLLEQDGLFPGNAAGPAGQVGDKAAADVLAVRHRDGANQAGYYADTTGYAPQNQAMSALLPAAPSAIAFPGRWQPLTYLNSAHEAATPAFICPHWNCVTPFALISGDQFRPAIAPQHPLSQGYLDQARHVMEIQTRLTPEQKVIAEYWADGPNSELPPGHWTEFAAYVASRDKLDLDQTVKLFFALANAIFDASIATWDAKVAFDYVRPVTAIRHLFRGKTIQGWAGAGKGIQEIQGEAWRPFQVDSFPTPPFAEFTSGHSGFSMAAATVLKCFTESDDFGFYYVQDQALKADPDADVTGILLHWPTFTSAARQAGESRLYGGIHFYEGNVVGLDIGERVGLAVFKKARALWSGG